jgi:hypothetical protein
LRQSSSAPSFNLEAVRLLIRRRINHRGALIMNQTLLKNASLSSPTISFTPLLAFPRVKSDKKAA